MGNITKTLGGDRLGSGGKNKQSMRNFERSTHNLSESFKSSATVGLLYPCYTNIGLNGDTFEIKIDAGCKTIPTRGPLFGRFKMQVDVFSIPVRLYQGILHNNPLNIGLKMAKVQLPTLYFKQKARKQTEEYEDYVKENGFSPSSLEKYLGMSGIGVNRETYAENYDYTRELACIWELAYYDIFKNYYANKQEEKAFVVSAGEEEVEQEATYYSSMTATDDQINTIQADVYGIWQRISNLWDQDYDAVYLKIDGVNLSMDNIKLKWIDPVRGTIIRTLTEWKKSGWQFPIITDNVIFMNIETMKSAGSEVWITYEQYSYKTNDIHLQDFPLENIDKMRYQVLGMTELGKHLCFKVGAAGTYDREAYYPYKAIIEQDANSKCASTHPLVGLVCKTYQSDLFNNWVQTEWIDGDNGINAITAVQTDQDGKFTIDALNLANKVYNMLNRIAISGGTYQDWQEAVYAEKAVRHAETPIYLGGMSSEVVFDEVVSTAATSEDALGTLGGRGRLSDKDGGRVIVKCTEPSIIMAILSFTPRIEQTQGNAWYRTEITNVDDLHKPSLDQIGFQDLLEEQMAWWSTSRGQVTAHESENFKPAVGKVPAWINYMTAIDKAYGDFAQDEGKSFMVLSRNYSINKDDGTILDATTYIDPTKFNYAFAYTELASQNLWVQVYFDVKARRKMSAKQIPNL